MITQEQRVEMVEASLLGRFIASFRDANRLVVALDKPGCFLAMVSGYIWSVLSELPPERLEAALCSIERHDPGQSPAMLAAQNAIVAWVRAERALQAAPAYQALENQGGHEP